MGEEMSSNLEAGPLVTQLSFSGGTGSGCIAEMLLNGDIDIPRNLVVIRADTGMENSSTYGYCKDIFGRFEAIGIPCIETGNDLYKGIIDLKKTGASRFDMPPYWTKNRETGKRGRLRQKCTKWAKIAPMDRALRVWMSENLGISKDTKNLGENVVRKWIGFSSDEWTRIKEPQQKYIYFEYPLIDKGMTKEDIAMYYLSISRQIPPRSVCNACYANDVKYFKKMHDERPIEFWNQAVKIDDEIRDLSQIGVTDECYVSSTLISLRKLAELGFNVTSGNYVDESCHSGHCFV